MRIRTQSWDGGDADRFAVSLRAAAPRPAGIAAAVATTIERVRSGGDAALRELSEEFDGIAAEPFEIAPERVATAPAEIAAGLRNAIEEEAANVRAVAAAQVEAQAEPRPLTLDAGQRIELGEVPVGSAGIYVPGGRAPYPSSLVMGVVPARMAGVERVVVASPPEPGTGEPAPAVLAAAAIVGADAFYAVGGAQAIAAFAYGTESIPAVDVIAGPGSPWVQEAKLQCSRQVGIDGYAGPSELVVIALEDAPSEWIALDLCAQAEHGDDGLLVAISADAAWLERLAEAIEAVQARREDPGNATFDLVLVDGADAAVALTQALAPEHTEVIAPERRRARQTADDDRLRLRRCRLCDRVRRLRGRLQPRAADRRCRPFHRAARPGHVPASDLPGRDRRGDCESPAPGPSTRSPAPRASRSTASRRRCGPTAGTRPARRNSAAMTASGIRQATVERRTGETDVSVSLDLDGGEVSAATGIGFLDHMLDLLGRHGRLGLGVRADGDLETGSHHTVEDVGIALGQALDRALGDRAGITRYAPRRAADGRGPGALLDRHLRPSLLPLPLGAAAGDDRRLRGRADRRVLPRGREQREAHPAPVESLRCQCPSHDRGLLQGVRSGAADRCGDRPRGDGRAVHEGHPELLSRAALPALGAHRNSERADVLSWVR